MLEGQAATEQKGDEIVAPKVADLIPLLNEFATAVDAVGRQVDAEVGAAGRACGLWVARRRDLDERAGLRVQNAATRQLPPLGGGPGLPAGTPRTVLQCCRAIRRDGRRRASRQAR